MIVCRKISNTQHRKRYQQQRQQFFRKKLRMKESKENIVWQCKVVQLWLYFILVIATLHKTSGEKLSPPSNPLMLATTVDASNSKQVKIMAAVSTSIYSPTLKSSLLNSENLGVIASDYEKNKTDDFLDCANTDERKCVHRHSSLVGLSAIEREVGMMYNGLKILIFALKIFSFYLCSPFRRYIQAR